MPGKGDYQAHVKYNGEVRYNFPTVLKSICRIQVIFFPFDLQNCDLRFGSWSYSTADVDFYPQYPKGRLGVFQLSILSLTPTALSLYSGYNLENITYKITHCIILTHLCMYIEFC